MLPRIRKNYSSIHGQAAHNDDAHQSLKTDSVMFSNGNKKKLNEDAGGVLNVL